MNNEQNQIKAFIIEFLKKLGFSEEESSIYFAALENSQITILELSRKTGIERTKIYGIVENLLKKGILEETVDYKRRYIKACELSKFELMLEEKVEEAKTLENSLDSFKNYISTIKKSYNPTSIKFYRGQDGIKQMLWNELYMKGNDLYSFTYRHVAEVLGIKFSKQLSKEYNLKGIRIWDIQSKEFAPSITTQHHSGMFKTKARYISDDILTIRIAIDIYDDTVAMFNWHKDEIYGAEIKSEQFADFMKQIFMIIWNMGSRKGAL